MSEARLGARASKDGLYVGARVGCDAWRSRHSSRLLSGAECSGATENYETTHWYRYQRTIKNRIYSSLSSSPFASQDAPWLCSAFSWAFAVPCRRMVASGSERSMSDIGLKTKWGLRTVW
jgi:hypothetical protein